MQIEKLGAEPKKPAHRTNTAKKSILKLRGVSNPSSTKHSVRMLTSKGARKQRRATRKRINEMKKEDLDRVSKKLDLNPKTPEDIKKQILYHGVSAGFISLD